MLIAYVVLPFLLPDALTVNCWAELRVSHAALRTVSDAVLFGFSMFQHDGSPPVARFGVLQLLDLDRPLSAVDGHRDIIGGAVTSGAAAVFGVSTTGHLSACSCFIREATLKGPDAAARKGKHGGRLPVITDDMLHTVLRRRRFGETVETIQPDLIISTGNVKDTRRA